jgi:hypothetical protein
VPPRPEPPAAETRHRALDIERHDTPVPESFLALYPASGRPRSSTDWQALVERHAFCEDLAQGLGELARAQRVGRGVRALDPPLPPGEAAWVERRLVELLGWEREDR